VRLETHVIEGERGSSVIGINGAAAHLVGVGDLVIVIAYQTMTDAEARVFVPRVVHVDSNNRILEVGSCAARAVAPDVLAPPFATLDT
jgi:aspartate 1-decarboxylase